MNQPIQQYQQNVNLYLEQLLGSMSIPCPRLQAAMQYVIHHGGKRIRSSLVYLSGELLDIPRDVLNIIAASIELIHTYSLVHDDLPSMDNDDMRRGNPSCHRAFDEATAILTGDALQSLAFELLSSLEPYLKANQALAIIRTIAHATGAMGMVAGQSLDMTRLIQSDVSLDELKNIHALKTGCLIAACVESVVHADYAQNHHVLHEKLLNYAKLLGLVFQIQDDYLDQYGNSSTLGKTHGLDVINQKTTFCSFYGKQELYSLIETSYQTAKNILAECGLSAQPLLDFTDFLQRRSCIDLPKQRL